MREDPTSFNETFNKFKDFQNQWSKVGVVPKNETKNLRDSYNAHVKEFYNYVKINKELRDLDYKKNLEAKILLCERAEELFLEPDATKSKRALQTLHKQWKESGSVSKDKNDEIWERFRGATAQINAKYYEYIEKIKEQQDKNFEAKTMLCEKAEEFAFANYESHREWKDASSQMIKIQRLWKGIGYVPRQHNTVVYQRFRTACDKFFENVREFYAQSNEDMENNLQLKTDLCSRAESMQKSNEWKKTSEIFKNLQTDWKKIGHVPHRKSEDIWRRFRKACNFFFDSKKAYYENRKKEEKDNLLKKRAIIDNISNFETSENGLNDLKKLRALQKEWSEIGFVPYESKDEIYKQYKKTVNFKFKNLEIDADKLAELKFNEKIENLRNMPNARDAVKLEINKMRSEIENINADISVWENNLGFFSNTKNARSMLKDFSTKIEDSKNRVKVLKRQINKLNR